MIVRIATTAIATTAFGLAALAGTATANATSVDQEFLTNIDNVGIVFDTPKAAMQDAKQVCSQLASGYTGVDIAADILDSTDLTAHQAAVFVVESTYAYCPGFVNRVNA